MNISGNNMQGWAVLIALFGIASTLFWMVVGWRAMRAHERIAGALEKTAGIPPRPEYPIDKGERHP